MRAGLYFSACKAVCNISIVISLIVFTSITFLQPDNRLSVEMIAACPLMTDNLKKFGLFDKYFRQ